MQNLKFGTILGLKIHTVVVWVTVRSSLERSTY